MEIFCEAAAGKSLPFSPNGRSLPKERKSRLFDYTVLLFQKLSTRSGAGADLHRAEDPVENKNRIYSLYRPIGKNEGFAEILFSITRFCSFFFSPAKRKGLLTWCRPPRRIHLIFCRVGVKHGESASDGLAIPSGLLLSIARVRFTRQLQYTNFSPFSKYESFRTSPFSLEFAYDVMP